MTVSTEHIELNNERVATIIGTRFKVYQLVMVQRAEAWSATELHEQFPQLSLADIHAALAYYHDHKSEIDEQIRKKSAEADRMRNAAEESPFARRMRAEGRLP